MNEEPAVELIQLDTQPTVSIRTTIPIEQIGDKTGEDIGLVLAFLQSSGATPTGPFFARYHTFTDNETDLEHGVPVTEPITSEGAIYAGELPSGPAASAWHFGEHSNLGQAYQRLYTWAADNGHEPNGPAWEFYHWIDPRQPQNTIAEEGPETWRVQLIQPLKD